MRLTSPGPLSNMTMVKLSDAIQKLTLSILVQLLYQIQLYRCHGLVNYQIIMVAYKLNLCNFVWCVPL